VGLSAATYATALAAVTGLQSASDQAVIAARRPAVESLAAMRLQNDAATARLDRARERYDALAGDYAAVASDVSAFEDAIGQLSDVVAKVARTSASLPDRAALRTSISASRPASRPTVHATTGASGAP
jgi:hypothetical protein